MLSLSVGNDHIHIVTTLFGKTTKYMSDTQNGVLRRDKYENPLVSRYASKEMSYIWSPEKKFSTWRSLWIHLAEGQRELGLDISEEQLAELRRFRTDINYEVAKEREK